MGRWTRRTAGWVLFNPEYHSSPDAPGKPNRSWHEYAGLRFPAIDVPTLPSQRNYQKQMPIVMGLIGGAAAVADRVSELRRELHALFLRHLRPSVYGDALEHFYMTLHCPASGGASPPGLKIGAYNERRRAFYSDMTFDVSFIRLRAEEQRELFRRAFEDALGALKAKLSKRSVAFDIDALHADIRAALEEWQIVPSRLPS